MRKARAAVTSADDAGVRVDRSRRDGRTSGSNSASVAPPGRWIGALLLREAGDWGGPAPGAEKDRLRETGEDQSGILREERRGSLGSTPTDRAVSRRRRVSLRRSHRVTLVAAVSGATTTWGHALSTKPRPSQPSLLPVAHSPAGRSGGPGACAENGPRALRGSSTGSRTPFNHSTIGTITAGRPLSLQTLERLITSL